MYMLLNVRNKFVKYIVMPCESCIIFKINHELPSLAIISRTHDAQHVSFDFH